MVMKNAAMRCTGLRSCNMLLLAACLALASLPARAASAYFEETGRASWYGEWHDGRATAQGTAFDRTAFTAAHRTLPFGTIVQVTNLANHRMVKVEITDRGPHVPGRVIDVSAAAARELGMQHRGTARVRLRAFRYDQFPG